MIFGIKHVQPVNVQVKQQQKVKNFRNVNKRYFLDISTTKWKNEGCHQERKLRFKIPVKHLLGPRETAVTQTQKIHVVDES